LVGKGLERGSKAIVDGRSASVNGGERGAFLKPTILTDIAPDDELRTTEIFGPVLALQSTDSLEDAIRILSESAYGNAASIFTSDGNAARKFRYEVPTGNVGVNIGVAAPMAYFPFSGWKDSFLGVLHGQGRDGVEFYTDKKVVIERWPKEWSRKF
jgi:malonate-semialdehyde dehydrogenase (acetylating)/methylmalonate-semialdehyde dehydrogenase